MAFKEITGDIQMDTPKKYKEVQGDIPLDEQPNIPQFRQDDSYLSAGTRETISDVARPILEYGGAALGGAVGLAGGVLGGPPGMAASGALGGTLGYAGGKAAANVLDAALGVPRKELIERARSEHPISTTISQTLNDLKYGAELELGGGSAGAVATKAIGKLISPLSKEVTSVTGQTTREIPKDIQELIGLYKEAGIKPSPAELAHGGKTLAIVESVLGYSPFSGDVILKKNMAKLNQLMVKRGELINNGASDKIVEMVGNDIRKEAKNLITKYSTRQGDKVDTLVAEFMNKYGSLSKYQSGLKFREIAEGTRKSMQDKVNQTYAEVKQSLPQQGQDVITLSDTINDRAKELLRVEMSKAPKQRDKDIIATLEDFVRREEGIAGFSPEQIAKIPALKAELNPPVKMTWEGLEQTRGTLLEKTRKIYSKEGMATNEARIYTELANNIDDELSRYAGQVNPEAKAILDQARSASRTMHEYFDKDILKIMNKPPEDILKRIVNNGEVTLLKQIEKSMGEEGLIPLRQGFFKQTLESSMKGDALNPVKLKKVLATMGDETLSSLANKEQIEMLKGIADKGLVINSKMAGMKTIQFLETLTGTSNERVIDAIFKTGKTSNIRLAKRLLSPERIKEITSSVLEKKIFKVSGTGSYTPISSAKEFFKHEPELKALMSPDQFKATRDFIKLGQRMSNVEALARNSSQTGQVFVGADALKLLLRAPLSAVKMTGVPWILSKMYTSPLALKYMTSAAKLPPNSPEAINLFIKGWGIGFKENQNEIIKDLERNAE